MSELINVTRSSMPSFEEYCEEIRSLWESRWLTNMGEKHNALESALREFLGVSEVSLFSNGHLALEAVLSTLEPGSEVITTPFTFASTTHAIVRNGLIPVFCDIDPITYTINADLIEPLITEKTSAIVPVHVYGNFCEADKIASVAAKHGLRVIYDAAHAFGAFKDGKSAASFGDASMFSFHATKVFHTIEGGAVCSNSPELTAKLSLAKNFGISGPESVPVVGGNAKMNEFCAAMGLCNLRHLPEEITKRKVAAERYVERLSGVPGIKLNAPQAGVQSNYAYFPVVFDGYKYTRDELCDILGAQNIKARKYFYPITNSFDCYKGRPGFEPALTPAAAYYGDRVVTLPLYADLTVEQVDRICDVILK